MLLLVKAALEEAEAALLLLEEAEVIHANAALKERRQRLRCCSLRRPRWCLSSINDGLKKDRDKTREDKSTSQDKTET